MSTDNQSCGCGPQSDRNTQRLAELQVENARLRMDGMQRIAGIAGPGWQNSCGVYRSFIVDPPRFRDTKGAHINGQYCITPGESNCNAMLPMGGWKTPIEFGLPAWDGVSLASIPQVNISLFTSFAACIVALAFYEVTLADDARTPDTPAGVRIGDWSTQRAFQLFPGLGRDSKAVSSLGVTQELKDQKATEIFRPITEYTEQTLLDGQNNLPLMMAGVNTIENQTGFNFAMQNRKLYAVRVGLYAFISYNAAYEGKS